MDPENTTSSFHVLETAEGTEAVVSVPSDPPPVHDPYSSIPTSPFWDPTNPDHEPTSPVSPTYEPISPRFQPVDIKCLTCCTQLPKEDDPKYAKEVIKPCRLCNNSFCTACVKSMFIEACKDTSRMPPRCCVQINLHHARPLLTEDEVAEYKSKYEEWSTAKPFYCPAPKCSVFIPDRLVPQSAKNKGKLRVDSGVGTPTSNTFACPKCETDICTDCRQTAHANSLCVKLEFGIDTEMAKLLESWGYKRCPKCGQGLKRMHGCNHMECRCGAHFCWGCLESRDDCVGGCAEDEDDEDYNSDEQEESNEPESTTQTADTATLTTTQPDDTANTQVPSAEASESTTPPRLIARSVNLDGRGANYWINQDLNFGDEPTEDIQDRSWDCRHNFSVYQVPFAAALNKTPSAITIECEKCWCTIHPEIRAPIPVSTSGERIVSGNRSRGRGRGRGRARFAPLRGLYRADATISETSTPTLAQSVPAREPSPMQDIQYTNRILDTYGNIITTSSTEAPRRTSLDDPHPLVQAEKKTPGDFAFSSSTSSSAAPQFSLAHECKRCRTLVCETCKADLERVRDERVEREVKEREEREAARDRHYALLTR
ncbi:hypothetical protein P153DRAFT_299210 [Dothidotthia symphoricarpi CBS 119687]|uniref:RBR-type E3 ubiquitin transferase n=1 Tax=Dothidotthia symphoricarpi CBS 119687 TaxID=1392245 RepID=A0A6A6A175_9PLEO|nr:uncharacterized protein P153DRAFT_299210 [Dothidotthia symphoricarpi CBS 119687]KAF2125752.1 hypothetical protein P153DRAFT_299210 [Dothidotthia symphoricarpi CBS 119687]